MEFVSDFVSEPDNAAIIIVVGIGGGGCNAINRMVDAGRFQSQRHDDAARNHDKKRNAQITPVPYKRVAINKTFHFLPFITIRTLVRPFSISERFSKSS